MASLYNKALRNNECPICETALNWRAMAGDYINEAALCQNCDGWLLECYVCDEFVITERFGDLCPQCHSDDSSQNGLYLFR